MLETELKCILSEETYLELEKMFAWDWVKEQINHYYTDSSNELKKHGITLRIRTKDEINKIQIKTHKNADSPLQICEEAEYDTDSVPESFTADAVKKMTGLNIPVSLLGSLTTLRHSLMYCEGVEICLDKNDFLDKTDYEIEIEYSNEVPKELIDKLRASGVEFKMAATGKCTRFMLRLAEILRGED
ncbi:MAG: CYTH domain-containing protein [Oscillospiraceae bacterium]|nr:CYTH domain-containing protein [Oscillospiraceae bacterium]